MNMENQTTTVICPIDIRYAEAPYACIKKVRFVRNEMILNL